MARPAAIGLERRPAAVTLLDHVAALLEGADVAYALVGAGALAVHGVSRSTVDHDLLTTEPRVLTRPFWIALPADVLVDQRRGDGDDPLAGVVRFTQAGQRDVDLMVGRAGWMDGVLQRRTTVPLPGHDLPVVSLSDLILLKLYAGGTQDRWDIAQLLATTSAATVQEDVESRLHLLPSECGSLWQRLASPGG